jgi:hypothetical protein
MESQLEDVLVDIIHLFNEKEIQPIDMIPLGGSRANTTYTRPLLHFDLCELTVVSLVVSPCGVEKSMRECVVKALCK